PPAAAAATIGAGTVERSVSALRAAQNADGGYPTRAGGASDPATSVWSALALEAAGLHPRDERRKDGRPSAWTYLEKHAKGLTATADLARLLMVVGTAEGGAATFGGVDLVAALNARIVPVDGNLVGMAETPGGAASVEATAWAVLGFAAAKDLVGQNGSGSIAAQWLAGLSDDASPGWGPTVGGAKRVDTTALALQAIKAFGMGKRLTRKDSAAFAVLRENQLPLGGFPRDPGSRKVDPFATALVVQAYRSIGVAAADITDGADSAKWLAGRAKDGTFGGSVLTTAQVLAGLNGKAYPLPTVSRAEREKADTGTKKDASTKREDRDEDTSTEETTTGDATGSGGSGVSGGGSDTAADAYSGATAGSQGATAGAAPS
ncbi:hypothetical protein ACVU7I_17170, partial [Patulibacter sp. S7RM1-6]